MTRDEARKLSEDKAHRDAAQSLGISEKELQSLKYKLKVAWDESGGIEVARARLKFAEDFLAGKNKR